MDKTRELQEPAANKAMAEAKHRRFGLKLFAAYLAVYAGFIGVAAFKHAVLSAPAMFGVNLAIVYGFGLIGFAFVLALVFLAAGSSQEKS